MKKLNNRGYMLVEIVLASAIAFGLAYFLLDLTINLKNKNDELLVKTMVSTDQAIIANTIMRDLYANSYIYQFDCSYIEFDTNNNIFKYNYPDKDIMKVVLSDYTIIEDYKCTNSEEEVDIYIKIRGKLSDENFDLNLKYKK